MNYSIVTVAEVLEAEILSTGSISTNLKHLLIDSRKIDHAENSLFFAIKGGQHDGHKYISELFEKGVKNFVVEKYPSNLERLNGANFIVVPNSLEALQKLTSWHRKNFRIPVIGITGSNGKTIIKEWLYQLLREDKNIVRSPKSYNSQVGVPLSVWQIKDEHQLGIFEAGISESGEMKNLEEIISPTIGVFTNIGHAHAENFRNINQKISEKLKLFVKSNSLIYCKDYVLLHDEITSERTLEHLKLFTWSRKTKADLQITKVKKTGVGSELQGIYKNEFIEMKIPFTDDASVENAIHCWAVMLFLNYTHKAISDRMAHLTPVAMRLELKEGINNCSIINDSYNSDLGSLSIALDFLNQQKQHTKKTIIISDILQSGKDEDSLYKEVAELLSKKGVNKLIGKNTIAIKIHSPNLPILSAPLFLR